MKYLVILVDIVCQSSRVCMKQTWRLAYLQQGIAVVVLIAD